MSLIFANSAHVSAPRGALIPGGGLKRVALKVRYGLYTPPDHGPILIDTGYGPEVTSAPGRSALLRSYNALLGPKLVERGQPEEVLRARGLSPEDVRLIVLTHFHADHICGLERYPNARVLAHGPSLAAIRARGAFANLRHGLFPELIPGDLSLEDFCRLPLLPAPLGLGLGHDLLGDGSLLAIDLPGHAEGHIGLFFAHFERPLLYATDSAWLLGALEERFSPAASLVAEDPAALQDSAARVAQFRAAGGEVILCHDPDPTRFDLP